jgi:hypothetical protein
MLIDGWARHTATSLGENIVEKLSGPEVMQHFTYSDSHSLTKSVSASLKLLATNTKKSTTLRFSILLESS